MKKVGILLTLVLSVLLLGNINVRAEDGTEGVVVEQISLGSAPDEFFENPSDTLNGLLYSQSVPTVFWDLSNGAYTGNLVEVRSNWLYTNYYFLPNSSGILYLDFNIKPIESDGTKMKIGVYNISTRRFDQYFTTAGAPNAGCIRVKNLNANQHYAFAFIAIRDLLAFNGVKGTIQVYR